jgi:hypothetical protein
MNGLLGEIPNNGRTAEETFANRFFFKQAMIRWQNINVTTKNLNGTLSSVSIQSLVAELGFPMSQNDDDDDEEQTEIGETTLQILCAWSNSRDHLPLHLICSSSTAYLNCIILKHQQTFPHAATCIFCQFFGDQEPENKGNSLLVYALAHSNISDIVEKISLFERPTFSSMLKSPEMKTPLNLMKLSGVKLVFHRNSKFKVDERNDWSVNMLSIAIKTRLTAFTQGIDKFSNDDEEFDIINIDYTKIKVNKSLMIASNERVDSKLWSRQSRANVLVICPWRDQYVTQEIHERHQPLSRANDLVRSTNFPDGYNTTPANLLHPALVHCFLSVSYDVVSKKYREDHPNCSDLNMWENVQESKMETLTAIFALCDFYKAHIHRLSHAYGGLAELWTTEFYDTPFENISWQSKKQLASHLVPVNRLAGKFLPGKLPQSAEQRRDKVAQKMLVLRVPIRL